MKKIVIIFLFVLVLSSCRKRIPLVSISSDGEIAWHEKRPVELIIQETNFSEKTYQAGVKYRGGVSAQFSKNSLTVEFSKKVSFGNIPKDDDWIFNASYIDKTFMRSKICSDLFLAMHPLNRASHSSYIQLNIDDKPKGLYLVMEELNASNLGLNKKDPKAMLFKDPPVFFESQICYPQNSNNYYQQKFPKHTLDNKEVVLHAFNAFLFHSSDSLFAMQIENWVDIRNVIDWHLLLLLSNNSDGILKNFYLYKVDESTPFRFAVWDCDHSFGRDGDGELNMLSRLIDCNRSILLKRLMTSSTLNYQEALLKRWVELRKSGLFSMEYFDQELDKNTKNITPYLNNNTSLWPIDSQWYYDNNDFYAEVDLMKTFLGKRLVQLDTYFKQLGE